MSEKSRRKDLVWALVVLGFGTGCAAAPDQASGSSSGQGGSGSASVSAAVGFSGAFSASISAGSGMSSCKVAPSGDGTVSTCTQKAPPNSFDPTIKWTWTAPNHVGSYVIPLVGNFTDDNGDGSIDLCDTPDVLVEVMQTLYLLSGDTGKQILTFDGAVSHDTTPAFGDIDGDGSPDVVTIEDMTGSLIAFEHDGKLKWTGDQARMQGLYDCPAVSLYDLDGDGKSEILVDYKVFNSNGDLRFEATDDPLAPRPFCPTVVAADLDNDGKLEVIFGNEAYRADGTLFWSAPVGPGHPHVANFDDDPEPEILLDTADGIVVLEHDGKVKFGPVRPTGAKAGYACWAKPGVIHDFDGDGKAEIGTGSCTDFSIYDVTSNGASVKWSASVSDLSGIATASGFDFLGDGVADAIYADETTAYVWDGTTGTNEFKTPRTSQTLIEYPVVADVDNDGSADVLIVSNSLDQYPFGTMNGPALTVLKDAQNRWIPARRIWNQNAYHVTNVREDGSIPAVMGKNWQLLNTFRTNSQINALGADCDPPATPK